MVEPYGIRSRDVSLGYLALGEAYLESGDLARSRESTLKSINQTEELFGNKHQDMVDALRLIALVDLKQNKKVDALSHARDAVRIATAVFGENSPGLIDLTLTLGEIFSSTNN